MFAVVVTIHVIACLVLIAVILLQAVRGGGLSELAGSNQTQSILGTQTNVFMTRATEVCAVVFVITSLGLGMMSTHRGRSLLERERLIHDLKTSLPASAAMPAVSQDELKKEIEKAQADLAKAADAKTDANATVAAVTAPLTDAAKEAPKAN